jgi:hypothetical protein
MPSKTVRFAKKAVFVKIRFFHGNSKFNLQLNKKNLVSAFLLLSDTKKCEKPTIKSRACVHLR